MSNPWFRLYAEFASDHKIQMMPESFQRRYIMLLCLRCSNGDVTLHDEEVAFQLRISNEEWSETKAVFLAKNLIDQANGIPAWNKRQFVSDSSAERVRRFREKKKQSGNVTVTSPDTDTDTEQIQSRTEKRKVKRGTRLSPDAEMSDEWRGFCKTERPDLDPQKVFAKFVDYWAAKPGEKGTKLDWTATWRNWVREERSQRPGFNGGHMNKQAAIEQRNQAAVDEWLAQQGEIHEGD